MDTIRDTAGDKVAANSVNRGSAFRHLMEIRGLGLPSEEETQVVRGPTMVPSRLYVAETVEQVMAAIATAASDRGGSVLSAPDFLLSECANILWKKARRIELSRNEASMAIDLLVQTDIEFVPTRTLAPNATALSLDLDHPAYDCMYLVLAVERGDVFVAADRRFVRLVAERGASDLQGRAFELVDHDRIHG